MENGKKPHPLSKEGKALREQEKKTQTTTKTENVVEEAKKVEKGTEIKEMPIDPNQTYEFVLNGKFASRQRQIIPQTSKIWCEQTQTIRQIRMCAFEDSIYVDEQSEHAKPDSRPLGFTNGVLRIKGIDAYKIKYLMARDGFSGKKKVLPQNESEKNMYSLRDVQAEEQSQLKKELAIIEAKAMLSKAEDVDIENFLRSRFGEGAVLGKSADGLKVEAMKKANGNPSLFLTDFNNPKHKVKAQMQKAKAKGLISVKDSDVINKQGAIVHKFDTSRYTYDEALARWILEGASEQAKDFLSQIEDKL